MTRPRTETWFSFGLAGLQSTVAVPVALLVGLGLRLAYVLYASPYIDEFTTMWAAQRVLATGLPRFPSGALYTQGLIYTYLDAAALTLADGFAPILARLPSLVLSAVTLALMVYAARRLFRTRLVGFAALWLAVDAQAILWGGRARTYALLQPLMLLAFLAWYHGAVDGDRPQARWLAVGLLLAALLDQPLILLILPPLAILALAARGGKWLRQPLVWLQAGVLAAGVAARWFLYGLMVPAGATATAEPRAFVDLAHPFEALQNLLTFFVEPNRLLPSLLIVGGALWLFFRARGAAAEPSWQRPVLAMLFVLIAVWLEALLVVGLTWRDPRYLYPLLPLLFLAAEGVVVPVLRALSAPGTRPSHRWAAPLLAVIVVAWIGLRAYPTALAAAGREEWGYDRALAVVAQNWMAGDALATIAPAAALAVLGHGDYLAVEEGAQALVVERDGRRVDGWTSLPLLDSAQRLAEALDAHPHLWFIVDEMRLDRHFGSDYLRLLWERSDLVAFERGVFVFRSRPAEPPPAVDRAVDLAVWGGPLRLKSFALSDDRPQPGETVTVTLRWWSGGMSGGDYTAFVHLVSRAGDGVAGHDAPPLGGLYPVERWPRSARSQPFPDRYSLALPADLPPGRYRLEMGLYQSGTLAPAGPRATLDFLTVGSYAEELPPSSPLAQFGDAATLYLGGLDGELKPGGAASLRLAWQTGPAGFDDDYTLFLHLLDAEGHIAQQFDGPPAGGWYPTAYWNPGEVVSDERELAFRPTLAPGAYHLIAGLYRADETRLLLTDGRDSVKVAAIELKP